MSKKLIVLLSILTAVIYFLCVNPTSVVAKRKDLPAVDLSDTGMPSDEIYPAVIKIRMGNLGSCSAFVITNNYALTAAHCLNSYGRLTNEKIEIYNTTLYDTKIVAKAASMNREADVGLIYGDFSLFKKLKIDAHPNFMNSYKGPFVTCGYPYGDSVKCTSFVPSTNSLFLIEGQGLLYPGMSGGPVVDANTMTVVGINSAVTVGGSLIAPVVGVFRALGVEVRGG